MKKLIIATALALLALPAAAQALSAHDYRVRDRGSRIVHSVLVCDRYILRAPLFLRATHETSPEGWDRDSYYTRVTFRRGCARFGIWYPDELRYEGWYRGRLRLEVRGAGGSWIERTAWRRFWTS